MPGKCPRNRFDQLLEKGPNDLCQVSRNPHNMYDLPDYCPGIFHFSITVQTRAGPCL